MTTRPKSDSADPTLLPHLYGIRIEIREANPFIPEPVVIAYDPRTKVGLAVKVPAHGEAHATIRKLTEHYRSRPQARVQVAALRRFLEDLDNDNFGGPQ